MLLSDRWIRILKISSEAHLKKTRRTVRQQLLTQEEDFENMKDYLNCNFDAIAVGKLTSLLSCIARTIQI